MTGIEVWNPFGEVEKQSLNGHWLTLLRMCLVSRISFPKALSAISRRPDQALSYWDALNRQRRVIAIAGTDSHGRFFPYDKELNSFVTHLVTRQDFSGEARRDRVWSTAASARSTSTSPTIPSIPRLAFAFSHASRLAPPNLGRVWPSPGQGLPTSWARSLTEAQITWRLYRDGQLVWRGEGSSMDYATTRAGRYRVEVSYGAAPAALDLLQSGVPGGHQSALSSSPLSRPANSGSIGVMKLAFRGQTKPSALPADRRPAGPGRGLGGPDGDGPAPGGRQGGHRLPLRLLPERRGYHVEDGSREARRPLWTLPILPPTGAEQALRRHDHGRHPLHRAPAWTPPCRPRASSRSTRRARRGRRSGECGRSTGITSCRPRPTFPKTAPPRPTASRSRRSKRRPGSSSRSGWRATTRALTGTSPTGGSGTASRRSGSKRAGWR